MDNSRLFLPDKLTGPEKYRQWAHLAKLCLDHTYILVIIIDAGMSKLRDTALKLVYNIAWYRTRTN